MKTHSIPILILFFLMAFFCPLSALGQNCESDLMTPDKSRLYRSLLPHLTDPELEKALNSCNSIWYDSENIIPGYQDSLGDPKGFRPNTIDSRFINLAVPGGWEKLFQKKGLFNFPFGTGGVDSSSNVIKVNFWLPPQLNGSLLPVAIWKASFSRYHWLFPVKTQIGEILMMRFSDQDLRIFEIRVKKREINRWTNTVFRPFLNREELTQALKALPHKRSDSDCLEKLVEELEKPKSLLSHPLSSPYFKGAFSDPDSALDFLPPLCDKNHSKTLLSQARFREVGGSFWRKDEHLTTYAATTKLPDSIVPTKYEAGAFPVTDESCNRCHDQAGRQIGDFHPRLIAYGELWGEDDIFSWHPFESSSFLKPDGNIKNFNDDNRKVRIDLLKRGLVQWIPEKEQPSEIYRKLFKTWKYTPF